MPVSDSPSSEMAALGRALRTLRERAALSQTAAADAAGMTRQAWGNYEKGQTGAVLRSDVRARLAAAIGVDEDTLVEAARSPDELPLERRGALPLDMHLPVPGRVKAGEGGPAFFGSSEAPDRYLDMSWLFGANTGVQLVVGDSVTGRAESGQHVFYDRSLWPRRDQLCVIEKKTGEMLLKIYQKADASTLFVNQTFPELELKIPLRDIVGVYRVRLVGE